MTEVNDLTRRRSLMLTALVAAQMPATFPEARLLRSWLDTWHGLGDVVTGMKRQGFDVRLSESVFGWRTSAARRGYLETSGLCMSARTDRWLSWPRTSAPGRRGPTRRWGSCEGPSG